MNKLRSGSACIEQKYFVPVKNSSKIPKHWREKTLVKCLQCLNASGLHFLRKHSYFPEFSVTHDWSHTHPSVCPPMNYQQSDSVILYFLECPWTWSCEGRNQQHVTILNQRHRSNKGFYDGPQTLQSSLSLVLASCKPFQNNKQQNR